MRILIVDDNKEVRNLIKQFLEPAATAIRECNDGSESLSAYKYFFPDLVLMDVDMPLKDGFNATRELKQHFPDAHILIISQYDTPEYREEAISAGAYGYLQKDNLSQILMYISKEEIQFRTNEKRL